MGHSNTNRNVYLCMQPSHLKITGVYLKADLEITITQSFKLLSCLLFTYCTRGNFTAKDFHYTLSKQLIIFLRIIYPHGLCAIFLNQACASRRTPGFLELLLSANVCMLVCVCVCVCVPAPKAINN